MSKRRLAQNSQSGSTLALTIATLATGCLIAACQSTPNTNSSSNGATDSSNEGLKIGSLLPTTGDLSSIGQPMVKAVPLLVETANGCDGVNGAPVTLVPVDDQTDPNAGAEGMTKLAEVDKVAGVVGSFASSVSSAAIDVAVRSNVVMISPGSTSPVFTDRAKKGDFNGYWARTAPPDTYQAQALAKLAHDKGFKRVSTVVINNDYGVGFEKQFVTAFKKLGGTVVNEDRPTRYDPKAATLTTEATSAFANDPDAVVAVLYAETGALLLKAAYQQGVSKDVTVLLTDGVYSEEFPGQVGKTSDGKFILAGALGTVPGANGQALAEFSKFWTEKTGQENVSAFVPHAWDAAALLVLAAEAADENTGEGIQSKLREVANAPGTEVSDICEALALVRQGEDIDYQGASSNVDIDEYGDVLGSYDVWTVENSGELVVIDKVSPE